MSLSKSTHQRRGGPRLLPQAILWLWLGFLAPPVAAAPHALWTLDKPCGAEDIVPRSLQCKTAKVDIKGLTAETASITIVLPGGKPLVLARARAVRVPGGHVWEGIAAGGWRATVSLWNDAVVAEVIGPRGQVYALRFAASRSYVVEELDMTKRDPEETLPKPAPPSPAPAPSSDPSPSPAPAPSPSSSATCTTDPPGRVDIAVLYTDAAAVEAGSDAHIRARIQQALAITNWAFSDSDVAVQLDPVLVGRVPYQGETCPGATPCSKSTILGDLTTHPGPGMTPDVSLDNITQPGTGLRDAHHADLVVLVVKHPQVGGLANPLTAANYGPGFAAQAFAVVPQTGLTGSGYYYFAHEVGHLMGSAHAIGNGVFGYSHGHFGGAPTASCPQGFATIMAINDCNTCQTIPYWSNLTATPCDPNSNPGVLNQRENARSLNQTRHEVANFRCGTATLPANVWMKDTWDDRGVEPDPALASAPMWQSPYIWVRNARDTLHDQQHVHENPRVGQSNWVYVKLHNTGADTSGNLEVYFADASTSINWPSGWTLLQSVPVSTFAGNSTRIVEVQWANLPGAGHYCLVARWNSGADPMAKAEVTDVGDNTRSNNNIVWRNLNIIDLSATQSADADLWADGGDAAGTIGIEIHAPKNLQGRSFLEFGAVDFKVRRSDGRSLARGSIGARAGSHEVRAGGNVIVHKLSKGMARLSLKFQRPRHGTYPAGVFRVDVVQTRLMGRQRVVTGGVSYEIRTVRR